MNTEEITAVNDELLEEQAEPIELEIVYRDEHLIAINKPAGMLVHRSWLDKHASEAAL